MGPGTLPGPLGPVLTGHRPGGGGSGSGALPLRRPSRGGSFGLGRRSHKRRPRGPGASSHNNPSTRSPPPPALSGASPVPAPRPAGRERAPPRGRANLLERPSSSQRACAAGPWGPHSSCKLRFSDSSESGAELAAGPIGAGIYGKGLRKGRSKPRTGRWCPGAGRGPRRRLGLGMLGGGSETRERGA